MVSVPLAASNITAEFVPLVNVPEASQLPATSTVSSSVEVMVPARVTSSPTSSVPFANVSVAPPCTVIFVQTASRVEIVGCVPPEGIITL